jgi:hypothetical protein
VARSRCLHDADGSDFEPSRYLLDLTLAEQACQPMEHGDQHTRPGRGSPAARARGGN